MEGYLKFTASEVDAETTRIESDCHLHRVSKENKGQLLVSFMDALEIGNEEILAHVLAIKLGIIKRATNSAEDATESVADDPIPKEVELSTFAVGDTVMIGDHEMIVLEQAEGQTALLRKELLPDNRFGDTNNYDGSDADEICNSFSAEIAAAVGEDNMLTFEVDLTSDDGLKDYGTIWRRASLITAKMYRRFVHVLDLHKPDDWWWLATAYSTAAHDNDRWVKCVAPSGFIINYHCDFSGCGVRPFCILKSNIFVSKGKEQ